MQKEKQNIALYNEGFFIKEEKMLGNSIIASIGFNLGWDIVLEILANLLRKGRIKFRVAVAEGHPLWQAGSKIIADGKITKGELIVFLQQVDDHIPGVIDDIVIGIIVMALGHVADFTWDQSEKAALFAAISKMMSDGVFENVEAADVVDAINSVTGLLKK